MDIDLPEPAMTTAAPRSSQDQQARSQSHNENTTNETLWRIEELHSVSRGVQVLVDLANPPCQQSDIAFGGDQPAELPPPEVPKPPDYGAHPSQQAELERVNEKNAALSASLEATGKELLNVRTKLSKARQNESKLRSIILKKVGSQKVSDVEMRDKFVSLRQKVQAIANSQAYDFENETRGLRGSVTPETEAFWGWLTPKDRKNRVISEFFYLIHSYVLDSAIFSALLIKHIMPDEANPSAESTLQRFEELLELNRVNEDLITNWRILTIECVSKIKTDGPKARQVAQRIFDSFAPILADLSQQGQDDVLDRISEMCHDAYDLRMMMRSSKTKYTCEYPPTGVDSPCSLDKYEVLVEPISVEGGRNKEASDEIAYTLFGGLVKHAETGKKVLEKAQVIMKRR